MPTRQQLNQSQTQRKESTKDGGTGDHDTSLTGTPDLASQPVDTEGNISPIASTSSKASARSKASNKASDKSADKVADKSTDKSANEKSEFARQLADALKDRDVQQGFEAILKPTIASYVSETLKPFQSRMEDMEVELIVTKESVTELEMKSDSVNLSLQKRIRELERQARSRNLRLTGLTPSNSAGSSLHDKYADSLDSILSEAGIEDVKSGDIEEFIKINTPNPTGSNSTILIKLSSETKRNCLYNQRSKLRNCSSRHFLNEDLTKQDAKIFKRLRAEVKAGSLYSCWTRGGLSWAKATEEGKPFPVHE
jgi:hypothetical protein